MSLPFDQLLFKILVCPESKKTLVWHNGELVSTDEEGRRAYPVEDGIPIMLLDRSRVLSEEDWRVAMEQGEAAEA